MKRLMPSELRYLAVALQILRYQRKLEEMKKDKEWRKDWEQYCERNQWDQRQGTRDPQGRGRGGYKGQGGEKGKPSFKGAGGESGEGESMTALAHNGMPANRQLDTGFSFVDDDRRPHFGFLEFYEQPDHRSGGCGGGRGATKKASMLCAPGPAAGNKQRRKGRPD